MESLPYGRECYAVSWGCAARLCDILRVGIAYLREGMRLCRKLQMPALLRLRHKSPKPWW